LPTFLLPSPLAFTFDFLSTSLLGFAPSSSPSFLPILHLVLHPVL
jgi:hypothetical protein